MGSTITRTMPIGAELISGQGAHFRVWAPNHRNVAVVLHVEGDAATSYPLKEEANGYFSAIVPDATPGSLYSFRLGDDTSLYPDPASRFQPQGPEGPSQVIAPSAFRWSDAGWPGPGIEGNVVYEMHIGTFTEEGTWSSAIAHLNALRDIGISILEVMPVADFPGRFGWGYDGVDLYAPTRVYGTPDDFRRFVDSAHAVGLAVILDVVYNHIGPSGNYLPRFATNYFSTRYQSDWGDSINFDGDQCRSVREFVLANAAYWIREFHLDGLRLDATQQIFDSSKEHVITAIRRVVRETGAPRTTLVVAENEPQQSRLLAPPEHGGSGIDALWNDDFHHTAMVALTGRSDAYYTDYRGTPQEFVSTAKYGFLYQGQWYSWQQKPRGTPTIGLSATRFVNFIENHDQLANSGRGERCHLLASPSRYRSITALLLLAPQTPMLFQGQEFAASSPFFYFADHSGEVAVSVTAGRAKFLSQFRALSTPEMQSRLPDPGDPMTFTRCKLRHIERHAHKEAYALHVDLLKIRRDDSVIGRPQRLDGAVIGDEAFALRYSGGEGTERLLIVNLGRDLNLVPAPEPLLAPPAGTAWILFWTSEDPRYGGTGSPPWASEGPWYLQGQSAVLLALEGRI